MRWLSAFFLCGFLALASAMAMQSPPSLAMVDASPTPPSTAARGFCPELLETLGDNTVVFDPLEEDKGAVPAVDVEKPAEATPYSGTLRVNTVTLPATACRLGSLFYPGALITVISGQIDIFVEPGPNGTATSPPPEATVWRSDGTETEDLTLPGPNTIEAGDWVAIENRAIVGFRNSGTEDATFLVAANHPTVPPGGGGCGGGCRSRP